MNANWTILLLFLICASCNKEIKEISGTWASERPALPKLGVLVFLNNTAVSYGDTLLLRPDSTFQWSGCTIESGPFVKSGDSLHLHVKEHEWAVDSIQKAGYNGEWPDTGYTRHLLIKNGKLILHQKDAILTEEDQSGQVDTLRYSGYYQEFRKVKE